MHIAIDARVLMDKQYTGVSGYAYNLIKAILTSNSYNQYSLFYNSAKLSPKRIPCFASNNYQNIITHYPNKILNYLFFRGLSWPRIDEIIQKKTSKKVDIFWMPHINFNACSGQCFKMITIHDLSFLRFPEFFSQRQNFWHKSLNVSKMLKQFDLIVAISENTKKDIVELAQINPEKIYVIYSGIDDQYRPIEAADPELNNIKKKYKLPHNFLLFLGSLEPRKNLLGIIQAFEVYKKKTNNDFVLVLAGAPAWQYKEIYKLARKSVYKNDIKFLGYVPEEDKPYLYNLATIFLFPSFYEGFGFPPLEAMACGTPVISSFTSSLPEVLDGAAILVDPYNYNDCALAIEEIINNQKLRENFIKQGFKQAKKFSWQQTAQFYLKNWRNFIN